MGKILNYLWLYIPLLILIIIFCLLLAIFNNETDNGISNNNITNNFNTNIINLEDIPPYNGNA